MKSEQGYRYAAKSLLEQGAIARAKRVLGTHRVDAAIEALFGKQDKLSPETTIDMMALNFGCRGIAFMAATDPDRSEFYALGRELREIYSDSFRQQ